MWFFTLAFANLSRIQFLIPIRSSTLQYILKTCDWIVYTSARTFCFIYLILYTYIADNTPVAHCTLQRNAHSHQFWNQSVQKIVVTPDGCVMARLYQRLWEACCILPVARIPTCESIFCQGYCFIVSVFTNYVHWLVVSDWYSTKKLTYQTDITRTN